MYEYMVVYYISGIEIESKNLIMSNYFNLNS